MPEAQRGAQRDDQAPGLRDRIAAAMGAGVDLLHTRAEIFGQEAARKAAQLARGLGAFAVALAASAIIFLLLAALIAALFTILFGRVWAGILATLLLYAAAAGVSILYGWKALSRVRPLDFPVTAQELRKDWEALAGQLAGKEEHSVPPASAPGAPQPGADDLEARFRAGSE